MPRDSLPDERTPSQKRQAELEQHYQKGSGDPYAGVRITTFGEILWIMQQRSWSFELPTPPGMSLPILGKSDLRGINLRGANLRSIYLAEANLEGADLEGTILTSANFAFANLSRAHLRGADLVHANFNRAALEGADLREATLTYAFFFRIIGTPRWPALADGELDAIQQEAADVNTLPSRLRHLSDYWPGNLVGEIVARNPNTPGEKLAELALDYPAAFLANSALPLLFLEHPRWISPYEARNILDAVRGCSEYPHLMEEHAPLIALIEACAQDERT